MTHVFRITCPQGRETVVYALSRLGVEETKKIANSNGYRVNVRKLKLCAVPKGELELVKALVH